LSGAERAALVVDITGQAMSFLVLPEKLLRGDLTQSGLPEDVISAVLGIQANSRRVHLTS